MRREEVAEYIAGMTMPLCSVANGADLKTLAYLLEMVVMEAENLKYIAREDKVNQDKKRHLFHSGSLLQHSAGVRGE